MIGTRSCIGKSEEMWFAYSVQEGQYASALVVAHEMNPTVDGLPSSDGQRQVVEFRDRAVADITSLVRRGFYNDARDLRSVLLTALAALLQPALIHLHPSPAS